MLTILWNLMAFMIAMSVLITVHEFGHFWIARYCNVQVERFSVGFGKALWKYTDRHGTEYSIAPILLGGYVKMLDKCVKSKESEMSHFAFSKKTTGQRAAIIVAGPIANFMFSMFAYWLVLMIATPNIRPVIGDVVPNSIAENAKIISGMEIKAIDGIKTDDWNAVQFQLSTKIGNDSIIISVMPSNSNQQQHKTLNLKHWTFRLNQRENPIQSLGILPMSIRIDPILTKVKIGSAASKAGLHPGDRIIKINGDLLVDWSSFVNLVRSNPKKPILLEVERRGCLFSTVLVPDLKMDSSNIEGFAGVMPKVIHLSDGWKIRNERKLFATIIEAVNKTWQLIKLISKTLGKLVIGGVELSNLSGPISIAQEAGTSAKSGAIYYFTFLAFISVNLGVVNLFPLPVLDGGNLLFLIVEKLKGSLISEKIQNFSYRISIIFLILLIGIALFNDFSHL